jgi:probable HAF family extracellular repeat protein/YD repeat-containing protein
MSHVRLRAGVRQATQAGAAVEVPELLERALLDEAARSQTEPHGPCCEQRGNRRAPKEMTHGLQHPPTASPWPSPRGCRRGAADGAHHSHRHGGVTNPDGSLGTRTTRLGTAAGSRPGTSTRPRTPIPGFLLERGRYTRFDAPDAVVQTVPFGINNRGVIVGKHTDAAGVDHGFRRDARGRFVTIDVPGGVPTQLTKINDRGQIVGRYSQTHTDIQDPDSIARGFLLDRGSLTRIDVPGAAETQAVGINNRGQVVGEYENPAGTFHGFLWHKGRFTTIDKPGAATSLIDINDRGQILGVYAGDDGVLHNFLLDRGRYTTFDAPGVPITLARDLNNRGQVAGSTLTPTEADPLAGARGFLLAKGVKGPFTPVDVPGAPRNVTFGLNDRGQLVGVSRTPLPHPARKPPAWRRCASCARVTWPRW